jgi:adenylylsulfate kinase
MQQIRAQQKSQLPLVIWFTGLSASGKSTIAGALEQILTLQGYHTYLLDGDNVRHGLSRDLGFNDEDRKENIRRVGEVARLISDAGVITLAAFISPFRADRRIVRDILPEGEFIEVFVDAPLSVCRDRDPKGLYARAERGEIPKFTGIDSPYESPENPEIHIRADQVSVAGAVNQLLAYLDVSGVLKTGYQPVAAGY